MKIVDLDFKNILLDEKSYQNILVYHVSYKTFIGAKPLRIVLNKVDIFIRDNGGTKYLALQCSEKYYAIFNRIRYLITLKSHISYAFTHHCGKIKINSDDDLPIEKTLTLHNVFIFIKSVFH